MLRHLQMMQGWKSHMFKSSRSNSEDAVTTEQAVVKPSLGPVNLGNVDPTNADLKQLHLAAIHGRKKDIFAVLKTGIWIDFPNDAGQTALFCATLRGEYGAAELLLQNGAGPNEKSYTGMTPVHVACFKASLRALGAMIEAGGDLRLHDNQGHSCFDWARSNTDPKKRMKMLEFLKKSQLFAFTYSGDFLGRTNSLGRQPSILQMLRGKVGSQMSLDFGQETGLCRVQSHGYGRVYYGGEAASGVVSVIPLVTENQLQVDKSGITFESSSGFSMSSMVWGMTSVTIKRTDVRQQRHNSVDLLISEMEHLSKLRHPNLLLLMGLCQSNSFDKLMLVFERVNIGSLYHILHEKVDHLPMTYIRDIATQVCQAMLYIHDQNYVHCNLSSHSVLMVSMHQAKVGGMEFMMEMKKAAFTGRTCLVATSPHNDHAFRWMAPEVMTGDSPSPASDVYSFSCVLWEMITSELPWESKTADDVQELHKSGMAQLRQPPKSVALFGEIIERGLKHDPNSRPRDFVTLFNWLQGPLDQAPGWKPNTLDRLKSLQKESTERISLRSGLTSLYDLTGKSFYTSEQSSSSSSSTLPTAQERPAGATGSGTVKTGFTDSTNNHHSATQPVSSVDSYSSAEKGGDSLEFDLRDGCKAEHETCVSESEHKRGLAHKLPTKGMEFLGRHQFERSSSLSAVGRLHRYSRRTASLPWQSSLGVLRADRSPRLSRSPRRHQGQDSKMSMDVTDRSFKTLPPVKPASHSTDVKDFDKDQGGASVPQQVSIPSRKTKRASAHRSLPHSRNSPSVSPNTFPRSRSAAGDVMETSVKGIELSMPGSVRTLTEHFQTHLYNHTLRQSILRGSMTPHGILFDDLDTSPTCMKRSPNMNEIPPEGSKEEAVASEDKEVLTGSSNSSSGSLTSVSFREESILDEDDEQGLPFSSKNELDISNEPLLPKPSPIYPRCSTQLQNNSERTTTTVPSPGLFQEQSAFRVVGSELSSADFDRVDGCADALNGLKSSSQFLPSCISGTDFSSHPFDFQDYYIDDEYTGLCEGDSSRLESRRSSGREANRSTDRSRRRTRDRVWLGDNQKGEQAKRGQRREENGTESRKESLWLIEQKEAEDYWKDTQATQKLLSRKWPAGVQEGEQASYQKEDQWLDDQWEREREFDGTSQEDQRHELAEHNMKEYHNQQNQWKEDKRHEPLTVTDSLQFEHGLGDENVTKRNPRKHAAKWFADNGKCEEGDAGGEDKWRDIFMKSMVQKDDTTSLEDIKQREKDLCRREYRQSTEKDNTSRENIKQREEDFCRREYRQSTEKDNTSPENIKQKEEDFCRRECQRSAEKAQSGDRTDTEQGPTCTYDSEDVLVVSGHPGASCEQQERQEPGPLPEGEADEMYPGHHRSFSSRESSLSTVVERPVEDTWNEPACVHEGDEEDDNDHTLVADDVPDQRRCILLNLERNAPSQEELTEITTGDTAEAGPSPRLPSPQSTLRKFYLGSSAGSQGYTTTLRVESSLQNPGCHRITHIACDTSTGVTQTVHEETVQAETLRTTMGIQ